MIKWIKKLKAKLTILKNLLEKEKIDKQDLVDMQSASPETMDKNLMSQHKQSKKIKHILS